MANDPLEDFQETLDALDSLLGNGGSLPRRQASRDSRSIPYDRSRQGGVYFAGERNRAADSAAVDTANEISRQRTIAERHALADFAAEQADFWDRRLESERNARHRR
jgi:hypothetical protein